MKRSEDLRIGRAESGMMRAMIIIARYLPPFWTPMEIYPP